MEEYIETENASTDAAEPDSPTAVPQSRAAENPLPAGLPSAINPIQSLVAGGATPELFLGTFQILRMNVPTNSGSGGMPAISPAGLTGLLSGVGGTPAAARL